MTAFDRSAHTMLNPLLGEPHSNRLGPGSPPASEVAGLPEHDTCKTLNVEPEPPKIAFAVLTCGNCGYKLAEGSPYCPQCQVQFSLPTPAAQARATPLPSAPLMQEQEQTSKRRTGNYLGWITAACVMVGLLLIALLPHSASTAYSASAMPKDTDLEINGTYDKEYGKFAAKGRIINTSQYEVPNVEIDSAMHGFTLGDHYDARDTVVVDTLHNLRPGETRDFDYRIDVPQVVNSKPWLTEGMSLEAHVKP